MSPTWTSELVWIRVLLLAPFISALESLLFTLLSLFLKRLLFKPPFSLLSPLLFQLSFVSFKLSPSLWKLLPFLTLVTVAMANLEPVRWRPGAPGPAWTEPGAPPPQPLELASSISAHRPSSWTVRRGGFPEGSPRA